MPVRIRAASAAVLLVLVLVPDASVAQIDLPLGTWVKRPLPSRDQGPCPGDCKHVRLALNPQNGRIYFMGGDYGSSYYKDSGHNDVYSYSIADATWQLEYPYCGPGGQYQPSHPDEVGWAYDTKRNIFWMVPGYMGVEGDCPSPSATQIRFDTMTFDPASKTWAWPQAVRSNGSKYAVYDPVEDTIIQVIYNGGPGIGIYHIATDTWENTWYPGSGDMTDAQTAADMVDRKIYVVGLTSINGVWQPKLWCYDMDLKTFQIIDSSPPLLNPGQAHMVWDSRNRVLILVDYEIDIPANQATSYAYSPSSRVWQQIPLVLPEDGGPVYGNHLFYDPNQNAVLLMGGSIDPARPYFYLYRYGAASRDSIAPSAPANLRPR